MAGRKRTLEPDPTTPSGQCALYLRRLLEGKDIDAFAELIGKSRATLFNYLAGTFTPSDETRHTIAQRLGLRDYRDLMPTDEFLAEIGQKPRRGRKSSG